MTRTETVYSAGGVIARGDPDSCEIALIATHRRSRWALPKGLVEDGETADVTAAREVREETGLHGECIAHVGRAEYWYVPRPGLRHHKFVDFYLFRWTAGEPQPQASEVDDVAWFPVAAALKAAAYSGERKIITRAAELWRSLSTTLAP